MIVNMKISIIITLLAILFSIHGFVVRAQTDKVNLPSQFEKGDISEIKNIRRVFVKTEKTSQSENIVKALTKYQGVEVVNVQADAEFVIEYRIEKHTSESPFNHPGAPPLLEGTAIGVMQVYIPLKSGSNRLAWESKMRYLNYRALSGITREWEQPLEKSVIGKFIKALKKLREEK
jgi:hypothetical protein